MHIHSDNNLLIYLHRWASSQDENFTTEAFVHLLKHLIEKFSALKGESATQYHSLITFVKDRPGHDLRYSLSGEKMERELGWKPRTKFDEGIEKTLHWYVENQYVSI